MKIIPRFLLVFFLSLALVSAPEAMAGWRASPGGTVPVSGYTRSNGTYVAPYVRRAPGTAAESHAFSATGGSRVIDISPSQEARDKINAVVKEAPLPPGCSTAADRAKTIAQQPPLYGWAETPRLRVPWRNQESMVAASSAAQVHRNSQGRIQRSETAKRAFMRMTNYPNGRPGYVIDHVIPLKRGGPDDPSNMQWQTVEEAKVKDRSE